MISWAETCEIIKEDYRRFSKNGGVRPRTSAYNSEILQSESLAEVSCPVSSKIDPFPGRPNSHISNDAYKLKVEKMKTDVLGWAGGVLIFILKVLFNSSFCITFWFRIACYLNERKNVISKACLVLVKFIYFFCQRMTGIQVPIGTRIGSGLRFFHYNCIVIAYSAIIGKNCSIHQGVTIGRVFAGKKEGVPTIGNNVVIFPGASEKGIDMSIHAEYPKNCRIDPVDLCTILTNLLDNAIEACERCSPEIERKIKLTIRRIHQFIIIKIENSSSTTPTIRNEKMMTTKINKSMHGWGIQNVKSAVEKYHGVMEYDYKNKIFTMNVMLFYE